MKNINNDVKSSPKITMTGEAHIGEYSEGHLLKLAKKLAEEKTAKTKIFDKEAEARVPTFDKSELLIGRVLGRGGFCIISQVNGVTFKDGNKKECPKSEVAQENRKIVAQNSNGKESCYAIKQLSGDAALKDVDTYVNGIVDLALEAKWLAAIQHPHIISIKGMAAGEPYNRGFFVILDQLHDILTMRLVSWKKHRPNGFQAKFTDRKCKKAAAFWLERITVARNVSSALAYLHSHRVMHRDLKPDDVGFDIQGDVKLFDFGLAKEYDPSKADKNGCYKMTQGTGSLRYMAPEVSLGKPCNETIDVYSFGLLLYQILALEPPFEGLTAKSFPKLVIEKGARPVPDPKWPHTIITLMKQCWSPKIRDRPSMAQVEATLSKEMNA